MQLVAMQWLIPKAGWLVARQGLMPKPGWGLLALLGVRTAVGQREWPCTQWKGVALEHMGSAPAQLPHCSHPSSPLQVLMSPLPPALSATLHHHWPPLRLPQGPRPAPQAFLTPSL